jgi:transcriptional regulator with XRE-family HTH domain
MTLGSQVAILRKKKGLSQADLGKLVDTSGDIIGRYERDEVKPSIDVVVRMADALEVSLDFLVGKSEMELDRKSLKRLQDIEKLPDTDKHHILYALDGLIKAAKLNAL